MSDVHQYMQQQIREARERNPDLAYRFIDANPDVMRMRMQVDGWNPVKREGSGVAGEVRIGDSILAAKPRDIVVAEQAALDKKNRGLLDQSTRAFYGAISRSGGDGQYLAPLSPEDIARGGAKWTRR